MVLRRKPLKVPTVFIIRANCELRHGISGEWDATRLRGYGMIVRNHGADAKYEDQFECWGVWRDLDLR